MIPRLLVTPMTKGLVEPCKRLSGERGGGSGMISREIGTPPPSHVSLTPPGLTGYDSKRLKEMEEEDSCPMGSR